MSGGNIQGKNHLETETNTYLFTHTPHPMAKNIIDIKNRTGKYFCLPAPMLFCLSILAVLFDSNETEVNRFSSTKIVKINWTIKYSHWICQFLSWGHLAITDTPIHYGTEKKTAKMTDVWPKKKRTTTRAAKEMKTDIATGRSSLIRTWSTF